jgi:hypothetical protein
MEEITPWTKKKKAPLGVPRRAFGKNLSPSTGSLSHQELYAPRVGGGDGDDEPNKLRSS